MYLCQLLRAHQPTNRVVRSQVGVRDFLFLKTFRLAMAFTEPPIQWELTTQSNGWRDSSACVVCTGMFSPLILLLLAFNFILIQMFMKSRSCYDSWVFMCSIVNGGVSNCVHMASGVPRGGWGVQPPPPRNSEDIGGVLDRISKKNRRLDFLL